MRKNQIADMVEQIRAVVGKIGHLDVCFSKHDMKSERMNLSQARSAMMNCLEKIHNLRPDD